MENENNKLDNILAQNGLNKDTVWGNAKRYFFRNLKPDIGLSPVVSPDSEDTESFLNQESSVVDQESPVVDKHYPTDPIYEKLYQAVTAAEWGGQYTTPETVEKGFFFRASERETEEGSSAYGPLQILGKTFAQNFGDLKHLKQMKKHSINPTSAQGFIDEYKEGAKGALRKRLTSEEKEFVDALIDQANLFLIYGREEDLKGYDEKFDYGGEGNIQELFPDNYKELYKSIGMKLIQSEHDTVGKNNYKFIKRWKEGKEDKKLTPAEDKIFQRYSKAFQLNAQESGLMPVAATPALKPEFKTNLEAKEQPPEQILNPIIESPPSKPIVEEDKGFLPKPKPDYGWEQAIT